MSKSLLTTILFLFTSLPSFAEVRLPKILGSQMVLQRNSEVTTWGWADAGETVRITGDWTDEAQVKANENGFWQIKLKTPDAGGPHTLTVAGTNTIKLEQILFGEVWIASGQSNMEMPLAAVSNAYTGILDAAKEIAAAKYPQIRLFQAGNFSSEKPLEDVEAGISMYGIPPAECRWNPCSPEKIPNFSSTAYFFARELHRELNVPIGIIDASWGGTSAETWTPASGLKDLGFTTDLEQAEKLPQKPDEKIPTRLYNGMIHPLRHFTIKGVIWYQGEGNAARADKYRELFSTMITKWREAFGYQFPFYFVQISPFNYQNLNAAYLRESQLQTMSLPKTGMVVTMDIGDLADIHPKNKQEVGRRLALWALAKDYGKSIDYSGPIYKDSAVEAGRMRLKFEHTGDGLATRDGQPPSDFQIAGEDKVFYPAQAAIDGNVVVVSSDKVSSPKAVRYGFTSQSMPNLMNKAGLPASSFRTDHW